ncbi:conserved Plasmodium protein, unknown function [Plasmodium relictum]|uniref:Uncharacterized protein n=1 Tax=Plasmodium relictum TaxID=85471 RepID=A0A1J1HAY0_PLARL|nr:conserved Plasmodium protein, unknown function [Plasmodium relictum]CRH02439.1 conserved Plasmodium protein, unknown function [Plasmodium relictum]
MSRLHTSAKDHINTNEYLDSLISLSKYNDIFLYSNFSNGYKIPHILKMYTNELHSSCDAYKSDSSHIKSENFLHQRTEQISENTYLNSILHSSDVVSSRNENKRLHSDQNFCYNPRISKNNYSTKEKDYSSRLNPIILAKNNSVESFYIEERKILNNNEESNSSYGNEGHNSMNCENNDDTYNKFIKRDCNNPKNYENNMKNYSEFSDIVKSINGELSDFYRNSSYIKEPSYIIENSLNDPNKNYSKNNYDLCERNKAYIDEMSSNKSRYLYDIDKDSIRNKHQLNYSTEISETSNKGMLSKQFIKSEVLNDFSQDKDRNNNQYYSDDKIKTVSEFSEYSELKSINDSFKKEMKCNIESEKSGATLLGKYFSNKFFNSNTKIEENKSEKYNIEKGNKKKNILTFNKKPKSYSLEDMKNGKVEIPSIIFMKLPFNLSDGNIIDSYRRNSKLLNFMNDCNDSTSLILKYPQIEKNKKRELKIPLKIAPIINTNMGLPIIYDDEFDRRNYHPNVQNLHMGKIFEKHVFSILKNKKDLGKKIFGKSSKFKKYKYDNNEGFWISNIDKRRLINPEKNNSYITELVYEKNNTYDEEIILKNCKNYNVIPPIQDLHKDNNFYLFLRKEKIYPNHLKPIITTIMRRYDVDKVSDYKIVESCEGITPVYE